MKNKEFQKLLRKNTSKTNSGFTLTELLVGMIMSIFVIGGIGFGLMQVLSKTQSEGSRTAARNETSRALDFISDEMRRAQAIEVDLSSGNLNTVASNYSPPTGGSPEVDGTPRLALQIPGVSERVIYSVGKPKDSQPWKGPLVIYRWGPVLNGNGSYSDTGAKRADNPAGWTHEALVDGVSDESQSTDCDVNGDGTAETITYQGFFACAVDDDDDGLVEDLTDTNADGLLSFADDPKDNNGDGLINIGDTLTDNNGDGEINFADSILDKNKDGEINAEDGADVDGMAITAQLFFTGGTQTAGGADSTYSADTQTVARARTAPDNTSQNLISNIMSFKTFDSNFACNTNSKWTMRTDFGQSLSSPSDIAKWNHKPSEPRQPQPIKIDGSTLAISSIPRNPTPTGTGDCTNSRVNNGRETTNPAEPRDFSGNVDLGEADDWTATDKENVVAVSHLIDFNDPRTFNGDPSSCTTYPCSGTPNGNVYQGGTGTLNSDVKVLKQGSIVPDYGGYDSNNNGDLSDNGDQISLGEFLHTQTPSLADKTGTPEDPVYTINDNLKPDERIIGFEIGHTTDPTTNPGYDLQDNIFIIKSDAFEKKYEQYDNTNAYNPANVN